MTCHWNSNIGGRDMRDRQGNEKWGGIKRKQRQKIAAKD